MSHLLRENIVKDSATGELYIPASKRPDGTWRKAVRVKEGYIPPDEVPLYESKGTQMAKKKEAVKKTIPGAVFVEDQKDKSNQKKKEAEAAAATSSLTKQMSEIKISSKITPEQIEADLKLKSIRKLKKQLREIEQLEEKIANGSLVTPEKEQLDKISKKQTVIEQLDELEE